MSKKIISLPAEIQLLIDSIVGHFHDRNDAYHLDLRTLCDWLEDDGWDYFLQEAPDVTAVDVDHVARINSFDDETVAAYEDLEEVTVTDRLAWGKAKVEEAIDNGDFPSVFELVLRASNGNTAVLGCLVEIEGQHGPVCTWEDLWTNKGDYFRHLSSYLWLGSNYSKQSVLDAMILNAWN